MNTLGDIEVQGICFGKTVTVGAGGPDTGEKTVENDTEYDQCETDGGPCK